MAVPCFRAYGTKNMNPTILYGAADSMSTEETLVYILALSRPRAFETAFPSLRRRRVIIRVIMMLRAIVIV